MEVYEEYLKNLPIIPDVAAKIMSITEEKLDISFQQLENIIKIDPALSAKILKIANSAMYARQKEIKTLQMAITLLGFKTIKSLVMLTTASNMFEKHRNSGFYKYFWKHSVMTAFTAKDLALRYVKSVSPDELFIAGLLHDIGEAAIYHANPSIYEELFQRRVSQASSITNLEEDALGLNHKEIGAKVLSTWNFPDLYVHTAKEHGLVNITSSNCLSIILVSIADILSDQLTEIPLSESKRSNMDLFRAYASLSAEQLAYYNEDFMKNLQENKLFQECKALFHLNGH